MADDNVPMDEAGFTTYMADRFRLAVPDCPVTVDGPLKLTIQLRDDAMNCMLDRAHDYCQRQPGDITEWLDAYVEKMRAYIAGRNAPIDRTMLRVVVRDKDYIERSQKSLAEKGQEMAVEPLTHDLVVVCYVDLPTAVRSATTRDFDVLGLTPAEALAQAKENRMAEIADFEESLEDLEEDVGIIEGDIYLSSWFALPEAWSEIANRYEEDLLVAVPAFDTILTALDTGDEAIISLHQAAIDVAGDSEQPLSRDIYRWTEDGWDLVPGPKGGIFIHAR
jgi:hypothetical protein